MSDSKTDFEQLIDALGKSLSKDDQVQRNEREKSAEFSRHLTQILVAAAVPRTEAGERVSVVTNKVVDYFLKPGAETENGLFQGCKNNADRLMRIGTIMSAVARAIPHQPTLSELAMDIVKSTGELGIEVGRSTKEFIDDHPVATAVAVGVATGGVAFAGAGPIAAALGSTGCLGPASTGTAISSLSGAALKSASLAKLGGGALAAGGAGMSGGAATVTGLGATSGGASTFTAVKKNK